MCLSEKLLNDLLSSKAMPFNDGGVWRIEKCDLCEMLDGEIVVFFFPLMPAVFCNILLVC